MSGNIYKLLAVPFTIVVFVIAGAIYRERRGKELTDAEINHIFKKSYAAVIATIIIILIVLFYLNNRPW